MNIRRCLIAYFLLGLFYIGALGTPYDPTFAFLSIAGNYSAHGLYFTTISTISHPAILILDDRDQVMYFNNTLYSTWIFNNGSYRFYSQNQCYYSSTDYSQQISLWDASRQIGETLNPYFGLANLYASASNNGFSCNSGPFTYVETVNISSVRISKFMQITNMPFFGYTTEVWDFYRFSDEIDDSYFTLPAACYDPIDYCSDYYNPLVRTPCMGIRATCLFEDCTCS